MKDIKPENFYPVSDIVDMNILTASTPNTQRQMLLRHIREKEVEAINVGGEKKPRYIIQGKHLIKYLDRQVKPKGYIKK